MSNNSSNNNNMNILIVGVSGFIGRHLYHALIQEGHKLIGCSRQRVADINWQSFSFHQSQDEWEKQLQTIDIVINAAGIYQQSKQLIAAKEGFSQVHDLGPKVLFSACRSANVKVIQISAIGANQANPITGFLQSKHNADQYLLSDKSPNVVLYPGIVLGEQGKSTQQLSVLASLSCIPLVFGKQKQLPLVSIYQLTEFIKNTIAHWPKTSISKILVAKPETMETLLNALRQWMNLKKGHFIIVPKPLINLTFTLFPKLSIGAFNKQSLMLLSDYSDKATPIKAFTQESASESLRRHQASKLFNKDLKLKKLFILNLFALGLIWLISGLSSIINLEQSRELISLIGIKGLLGDVIIFTAALGDILLGLLLWVGLWYRRLRRWTLYAQISVMLMYSVILSIMQPIFWLHPFAPIIKNLAMLVLAMYL
ncbi:MAG: SDR family oxidoreductase, partial [Gammaproteobacteria bacterium]|nr:SDR family oxidoreductase [Gammaproteobacteria bacterium]